MRLKSTIAMEKGQASLLFCNHCGTLVYLCHARKPKGPCPGCDKPAKWSEKTLPNGAFGDDRPAGLAIDDEWPEVE